MAFDFGGFDQYRRNTPNPVGPGGGLNIGSMPRNPVQTPRVGQNMPDRGPAAVGGGAGMKRFSDVAGSRPPVQRGMARPGAGTYSAAGGGQMGIPGGATSLTGGAPGAPAGQAGPGTKPAGKAGPGKQGWANKKVAGIWKPGAGRASTIMQRTGDAAKQIAQPAMKMYQQYYKQAMNKAMDAANQIGVNPSIYGQYAAAQRAQDAQMNRLGMGQSGAALAANRQLNTDFAQAQQAAQAQAIAQKLGAYQGLGGQLYSQGMGAGQFALNPAMAYAQHKAGQEAQDEANAQATQAGWGQLAGGVADVGLAAATGGMGLGLGGLAGMAGLGGVAGMGAGALGGMGAGAPSLAGRYYGGGTINPYATPSPVDVYGGGGRGPYGYSTEGYNYQTPNAQNSSRYSGPNVMPYEDPNARWGGYAF